MNLKHLYYFKTLAKIEHYAKAAEALAISQPSLSYAMAGLERELGVPLFKKQGRNIVLTKYGRTFERHITLVIAQLETGVQNIQNMKQEEDHSVYITFENVPEAERLTVLISQFEAHFSDIKVHLEMMSTKKIVSSLKLGYIDFGLCFSDVKSEEVDYFYLKKKDVYLLKTEQQKMTYGAQCFYCYMKENYFEKK
ncbi:MAG: LysR family transcriptional regulator [Eubacterium sp.]